LELKILFDRALGDVAVLISPLLFFDPVSIDELGGCLLQWELLVQAVDFQ